MLIFAALVYSLVFLANASDPDPIKDFCVAGRVEECKGKSSSDDFSSNALRNISMDISVLPPGGFQAILVSDSNFPGLNTMGLSLALAKLGPGGSVPLHIHPRASELIYIADGLVEAGFIDSNNVLYSKALHKGDMFIVPRGLLHYQYNLGNGGAVVIASFNSQDPGVVVLGPNLFGSGVRDEVLSATLKLNHTTIDYLRHLFSAH